ncbi:hypothetical protein [Aquimarina sp. 2201CG5-10]|uniref:hypothetical protein n=1 Tax=Aquimarina callyspongiae TaxID=3098150 RepID=UPI002AB3F6B1|nr:hypothetical protein [Aquimarina sp. 2201CG5-10]MDY8134056.1 hypothetical protein [Aquimarina sp. 2201CG5-10]
MNDHIYLKPEKIIKTIDLLEKRVSDRFPDSSLREICHQFLDTAQQSKQNIQWISAPNIPLRFFSYLIILIGLCGLIYSITFIDIKIENTTLANVVAVSEAIFNDIILLGAAIFFLISLESRLKTRRALKSLNDLRVIAHVIDMHQLTKDPYVNDLPQFATENSPKRPLSKFELQRYLDYCSEATALIGKVAALYSQSLPDEAVVRAVNEIEILTTGLSRKIWQKLIILSETDTNKIKTKTQ